MKGCGVKVGLYALAAMVCAGCGVPAGAQARPFAGPDAPAIYQRLLPQIMQIKIFDNHAHPGFADDPDVDAMAIPDNTSIPFRLRDDNPEMVEAAKELFGYPYQDLEPQHLSWLARNKAEQKKQLGRDYFSHVLDKLGIETGVANRVAMPGYLDPARFRWVFFVDSFLFPFNNRLLASRNPDQALFVPMQEKVLRRYMAQVNSSQVNVAQLPPDLNGYLQMISRLVEANQKLGGVGIKFEVAYFRSLHFDDPSPALAAAIYAKYYNRSAPPDAGEYSDFQDFIFRFLLREAGRLHLPVQIHTAVGGGDYFSLQDGNVLKLENVLRDPRYNNVTFMLLHGGYPHERQAIWLAARKNVFLDSSLMGVFMYPEEFKRSLKQWLELFPDKIVFGSDAFPLGEAVGAEESYWLATISARTALAAALAEMIAEGEISESKALELAHAYLHDTAARVYAAH
jgi:hypothetical protein